MTASSRPRARPLSIVIPVLNEAANLARLLDWLRAALITLAGSTSPPCSSTTAARTGRAIWRRSVAREIDLAVLTHEANRGPGFAFGTAFAHLAPRSVGRHGGDASKATTPLGSSCSARCCAVPRRVSTRSSRARTSTAAASCTPRRDSGHPQPRRQRLRQEGARDARPPDRRSFFSLYRGGRLRDLQECYGQRIVERDGFESRSRC